MRNQQLFPPFARDVSVYEDEASLFGTEEIEEDMENNLWPRHPLMDGNQRENRRWESQFKLNIPEFHGSHNANEFLDWLTSIESIFYSVGVPSNAYVNHAAGKFRAGAQGLRLNLLDIGMLF